MQAVVFGSMDAGPSVFANSGIKFAPERVDREGLALLAVIGAGARIERGPPSFVGSSSRQIRTTGIGALLGGYQFFSDWGVLALYAGPEGSLETLVTGAGIGPVETRFGLRFQGELWAKPSAETLATASVVLGSARWDVYGRASAGYRAFDAYIGPEITAYADRTGYTKFGLGLHATDFGFDIVRLRLSAGGSYEDGIRQLGAYVSVTVWAEL